jgi:type IV pilus assembly protein PilM
MVTSIVGVDIGSESLRGVELRDARKANPTVVRYHEVPLPEGAVKNGEVLEVHTVAAALKHLWTSGGFKSKDVVLGMGNPKVLVRDLTVPRLSKKEIRESLPSQVQDMLPVPVVDALLDFYPISEGQTEQGPVVHGLLVAAVKESVNANLTAVQLAGLTPVEMDLIPFALNRLLRTSPNSLGTVALVDVGANTTNVVITTDGVPQFVRIIPSGGFDITKRLMSRLELSAEEAERSKRELGVIVGAGSAGQGEATAIIRELTSELLNSLRNTLRYFVTARQGGTIDRIVLSGRGAKLTGFAAALEETTHVSVTRDDPFAAVTLAKTAVRDGADPDRDGMSVALGLALGSAA